QITLSDIHGLWGGQSIYLIGAGDCTIRTVKNRIEVRYALTLTPEESLALRQALIDADLVALEIPERAGVPGEARPAITLRNADGEEHRIAKWANDEVERFDRVYESLLKLREKTEDIEPVYEGEYEPKWRP